MRTVFESAKNIKVQPQDIETITREIDVGIAEDALTPVVEETISAFGRSAIREVANQAGKDPADFTIGSPTAQAFIRREFGRRIRDITDTTRREIGESLAEGIRLGEGHRVLAARVRERMKQVTRSRSRTIARTEVGNAANFAIDEGYRQSGIVQKRRWVTQFLNSRDTHIELNGQVRGIDEPFSVGGKTAMRPGAFGIAEEDINCRCRVVVDSFTIGERE